MGIFNNLERYTNINISEYMRKITQQIQVSGGLKLDANNTYDVENKKLTNIAEGTENQDAINKHQLNNSLSTKVNTSDVSLANIIKPNKIVQYTLDSNREDLFE